MLNKVDFKVWLNADQYIAPGAYMGKDRKILGLYVFTRDITKKEKNAFKNERLCTAEEVEQVKQDILNVFQGIQ